MKFIIPSLAIMLVCSTSPAQNDSVKKLTGTSSAETSWHHLQARPSPDWLAEGFTYQIMPRSFSAEGTLKGAEAQLERLADLGVSVVYLMPVNKADDDMDRSMWSPRQIKSGMNDPRNSYRPSDYFHTDPEYGTDNDLKDFVDKAHSFGMKVILDVVFAHCGPTSKLLRKHPDYFMHDQNGNVMKTQWNFPMLDHRNPATRAYFYSVMTYYVADFDIDGFRCDVADRIPMDFWEGAREVLDGFGKPLILGAEGSKPENNCFVFDVTYGRTLCKTVMHGLVAGKQKNIDKGGADWIRKYHEYYRSRCPKGALMWQMTENHDWATDDFENRMEKVYGHKREELSLAFLFAIDGVPFIFNGQEICYDKRLSMFGHGDLWIDWEKDSEPDYARDRSAKIKSWATMRKKYSSLAHGQTVWLDNDHPFEICSFLRHDGVSPDILFLGNYSSGKVTVTISGGRRFTLNPWGYIFEPIE